MKTALLILAAVFGVPAGTLAQGSVLVANAGQAEEAGFNTVSSNPADPIFSDFITGTVTLQIYSAPYNSTTASEAAQINALDASGAFSAIGAVELLEEEFTPQLWGPNLNSEALSQSFAVTYGTINIGSQAIEEVGSSSTLTSGSDVLYGIVADYTSSPGVVNLGALVLNGVEGYSAGGDSFPPANMDRIWPDQNLFIPTMPEPSAPELAALGGLSMLFLRSRKS